MIQLDETTRHRRGRRHASPEGSATGRTPDAAPTADRPSTQPVSTPGTRPAARPATRPAAKPGTRPATRPGTGPASKPAAPPAKQVTGTAPGAATRPAAGTGAPLVRPPRAPFVMLVVGMLGGALICLLVLNTILAEDAIRLSWLQQSTTGMVQQQQELEEQIARAESPDELARRAKALGMVSTADPAFVDPRTGRTYGRASVVPPPATRSGAGSAGPGRDARDGSGDQARAGTGTDPGTGTGARGGEDGAAYSDPSGFAGEADPAGTPSEW